MYGRCNFRIFKGGINWRAFSGSAINHSTAMSSVEQKQSLVKDFHKQFQEYGLAEPLNVQIYERTSNVYTYKWPRINLVHIFDYFLKIRDFEEGYFRCYFRKVIVGYFIQIYQRTRIPIKIKAKVINIANEIMHKKKTNNENMIVFLQKRVINDKKENYLKRALAEKIIIQFGNKFGRAELHLLC